MPKTVQASRNSTIDYSRMRRYREGTESGEIAMDVKNDSFERSIPQNGKRSVFSKANLASKFQRRINSISKENKEFSPG